MKLDLASPQAQFLADAIEARACEDLYDAAPPSLNARTWVNGGVTVLCTAALPVSYFNRVVGLGNHAAATAKDLDSIALYFAVASIKDYWIHVSPGAQPADLPAMLDTRGFAPPPRRSWSKFLRDTAAPAVTPTALAIRRARAEDATAVAKVVATAYGLPPATEPWFSALVERPHWQVWVGERDGVIVATGSLYVTGQYGWLGIGATLAEHRAQGAQSSLLAARIQAAREAGCELVATETGDPIADEKNQSLANIRRAGFERVCSRLNYAPRAPSLAA